MSNPNPFLPKGSLLEQQSQSRSRLKLAVFCVVAVGTLGLVAMLIQGCKRDTGTDTGAMPTIDTNTPPMTDTNLNPPMEYPSNTPPYTVSNPVVNPLPPVTPNTGTVPVPVPGTTTTELPTVGGTEYIVVSGDTLGKIAAKNHVTVKALEAANPGVDSKHLKIKQKLVIPAGGSATVATPTVSDNGVTDATSTTGATTYVVKSGDNLHKVSTKFGVSVKAIQSANHLTTTSIKVGQKLKVPAKTAKTSKASKAVTSSSNAAPTAPVIDDITAPAAPTTTSAPAAPVSH